MARVPRDLSHDLSLRRIKIIILSNTAFKPLRCKIFEYVPCLMDIPIMKPSYLALFVFRYAYALSFVLRVARMKMSSKHAFVSVNLFRRCIMVYHRLFFALSFAERSAHGDRNEANANDVETNEKTLPAGILVSRKNNRTYIGTRAINFDAVSFFPSVFVCFLRLRTKIKVSICTHIIFGCLCEKLFVDDCSRAKEKK